MTRLLTVKLRRDLRVAWARIVMMVAAIAVSLTVFSGVLFAWNAISRETQAAYLNTQPASATIRFSPAVDERTMAAIVGEAEVQPEVLEAAGRTMFSGEVQINGKSRVIPLQVFAAPPNDPMRMANFEVEGGRWPPAPGQILIRRDSLELLGVKVGDTVTAQPPNGPPIRLTVAGTVYDPSLAPAPQQQTAQGYLSTTSLAGRTLDQLKLQVAEPGTTRPSRDRAAIATVAAEVGRGLQQERGVTIREVQVPKPYAHPHQGQANALLSALLIGAGAALLLSTILVATMLNGLFTQQIPQLGIMKAIGADSIRVGRQYLIMTLAVAAVATLLALGPGIAIGRSFAPNVLGLLGIRPTSVDPAWWTYAAVLAVGLLLPVLMALIPLVRTARTTVRAAIDHRGLGSDPRIATRMFARLGRLPGFDRGLLMALRNTIRRPGRFALSAGLLASAGMMFVAGMSARAGTSAIADDATARTTWDVNVQLAKPTSPDAIRSALTGVAGVTNVEGWTMTAAGVAGPGQLPLTRTYPDQGHGGTVVTAIPSSTAMQPEPDLIDGRWLTEDEAGSIVLSQVTLANTSSKVAVGQTVDLTITGLSVHPKPTTWRVVGIVRERGDAGGAYVTAKGLAQATAQPQWPNTLRIATADHDETSRTATATAVQRALTTSGVDVRTSQSVGIREASTGGHLEPVLVILLATALPMLLIGCIGLASTMGANVLERTREFGVMHAVGARPQAVRRIVVAEGMFIAIASCVLAALPAVGLTFAMNAMLGNLFFYASLPFKLSYSSAVLWTALVVLGGILATEAAASRASRLTVREALAYL